MSYMRIDVGELYGWIYIGESKEALEIRLEEIYKRLKLNWDGTWNNLRGIAGEISIQFGMES